MSIMAKAKKQFEKMKGISVGDGIPKFWISTGSYVVNKIMSGKYRRGIPQGRITGLTGLSSAGKSFILGNIIASAQRSGCSILILDSEHALDYDYLTAIGVDVSDPDFLRITGNEINNCTNAINAMLSLYRDDEVGENPKNLLLCIDSLDFIVLGSAIEAYEKSGELSNDQGLHAKKLKQMLMTIMQDIAELPVAVVCTKQVYMDQTQYAYPPVKMTEALKFPMSTVLLMSKLFDKDKTTKSIDGIRMKIFGWKTRFTKPFQQVELTVPYDTGLDPYDGILQAAESLGIVKRNGAWYSFKASKFQSNDFKKYQEDILEELILREKESLVVQIEGEEDFTESPTDLKRKKLEELAFAGVSVGTEQD